MLTHLGTKQEAPVLVSLVALLRSLRTEGEVDLFRCRCTNPSCDEVPGVLSKIEGDEVSWLIDVGESGLRYDLDSAQAMSEAERVRSLVQREINGAHGRDFRFHPAENARLFQFPSRSPQRGWYLRNNVAYLVSVAAVSAAATALFRTLF